MSLDRIGPSGVFEWFKDDWLVSRLALKLFCISTVFAVALGPIFFGLVDPAKLSAFQRLLWGVEGVLGPVSMFFLWFGMWRYWVRLDSSTPILKTTYFVLMLVGLWYGTVPYCFLVYRRQVLDRTWARPFPDEPNGADRGPRTNRLRSIVTWAFSLCAAGLIFGLLIPKLIQRIGSEEYLDAYLTITTILAILLAIGFLLGYPLLQLFRSGMNRPRRNPGQ